MRGEDFSSLFNSCSSSGSPPHARGRLDKVKKEIDESGITPACAGKTWAEEKNRFGNRDHPRMRGEDMTELSTCPIAAGSPPHARGRQ